MEDILMKLNIFFFDKNNKLLEKFSEIWDKVSNTIETEFDSESVCNKKYLWTKLKSNEGKISINFYDNKIPKEGRQCLFLSVNWWIQFLE